MAEKEGSKQSIPIHIPEHIRVGAYSNVANVSLTEHEITILFLQKDQTGLTPVSKVILPISHAESLARVLTESLEKLKKVKKEKPK